MLITLLAATQVAALPPINGRAIRPGEACYTMRREGKDGAVPFGTTHQRIRILPGPRGGLIEVATRQTGSGARGSFDMRDVYVMRRADLRPVSYLNKVKGETKIELTYGDKQVTGRREVDGKMVDIAQPLDHRVWEGTLIGPMLAALPLRKGVTFSVPVFKYNQGLGTSTFKVVGEKAVQTPSGPEPAWVIEIPVDDKRSVSYFVSKRSRQELGYDAGFMSQVLGGECPK
ncbi:MAG TPA: hypothetical protein VIL42_10090 [Sphingomicrobium sp.]|jgi:hypothetical protein